MSNSTNLKLNSLYSKKDFCPCLIWIKKNKMDKDDYNGTCFTCFNFIVTSESTFMSDSCLWLSRVVKYPKNWKKMQGVCTVNFERK